MRTVKPPRRDIAVVKLHRVVVLEYLGHQHPVNCVVAVAEGADGRYFPIRVRGFAGHAFSFRWQGGVVDGKGSVSIGFCVPECWNKRGGEGESVGDVEE